MTVVAYPAGILRHSLVVEALTTTRQPDGTSKETWTPDPVARSAFIKQLDGQERFESHQMQAEATHKVKMRYYAGLTPTHRLIFGERTFNIVEVNNVEEVNVNHELRCREKV